MIRRAEKKDIAELARLLYQVNNVHAKGRPDLFKMDRRKYTDEELSRMTVARKYQIAQQCLYAASAKPKEAEELAERLGAEYAAWFRYVLGRKSGK